MGARFLPWGTNMTVFRLWIAALFLLLLPPTAQAELGDCTDPAYLSRFPEAPTAASILCVELFRFTVSTPAGPREIRGIQDVAGGWAAPAGSAAGVERGAREAAAAMAALGSFATDDITLLLLDDAFSLTPGRQPVAVTDGVRDPSGATPGECLVTLYGLTSAAAADEIAVTTAHEIFHCIQFASLSAGQMGTLGAGGDWWIEGSAEYFSAVAVSGSQPFTDRGADFDGLVDSGTALNDMAHEAGVFFFWWAGAGGGGMGQLMDFMRAMASAGGAGAQRGAMRSVLSDDQWLQFATDYADQAISHPQGGGISSLPSMRETRTISADVTETLTLAPFAILLGTFDYECGTWGHTLDPVNPNLAATLSSAWADWPEEVDTRDGRPSTLRFAGMHTGDSDDEVEIEIERRRSCQPCAGIDQVDACVPGVWQMTSGGPVEWMRAQGLPITHHAEGPRYATFLSDGSYTAAPLGINLTIEHRDTRGDATGASTTAFGRWSAADGILNICQDAGMVSGTVTVTTPRGSFSGPVSQAGAGVLQMPYSCSESGEMQTSTPIPGMGAIETGYTRIADPPELPAAP